MEEVKNIGDVAAQGELLIRMVDELPEGATPMKAENGLLIAGHSETGHHHAFDESPNVQLFAANDNKGTLFVVVKNEPAVLKHHRNYDTHNPWKLREGVHKITPSRESDGTLEGWQRALD